MPTRKKCHSTPSLRLSLEWNTTKSTNMKVAINIRALIKYAGKACNAGNVSYTALSTDAAIVCITHLSDTDTWSWMCTSSRKMSWSVEVPVLVFALLLNFNFLCILALGVCYQILLSRHCHPNAVSDFVTQWVLQTTVLLTNDFYMSSALPHTKCM